MVLQLIRGKQFYRNRLLGKYWRVILDGTGLFCFKERHCENCLCTTRKDENGKSLQYYYHKVLEAKLPSYSFFHSLLSLGGMLKSLGL